MADLSVHQGLTDHGSTPAHVLGEEIQINGKWYRYVKYVKTASCAAYDLLKWSDSSAKEVTLAATAADEAEESAGVALAALALNEYAWIQFRGRGNAKCPSSNATTSGLKIVSTNVNGGIKSVPATATTGAIAFLNAKAFLGIARANSSAGESSTPAVDLFIP